MKLSRCLFKPLVIITLFLGLSGIASSQNVEISVPGNDAEFLKVKNQMATAFREGDHEYARRLANELLDGSENAKGTWYYGNLIHYANLVLGRIALAEEDTKNAGKFLLKAGKTPGSPQLNSFGPNMTLARDLLKIGHTEVVMVYFDDIEKFWEMGGSRLKAWREDIAAGRVPNFGPNLRYGRLEEYR